MGRLEIVTTFGGWSYSLLEYHNTRADIIAQGALWAPLEEEQLEMAREASELSPYSENANFVMGLVLVHRDEYEGKKYMERALEINPESIRALSELANFCLTQKKYKDALKYAEMTLALKYPEQIERKMNMVVRVSKRNLKK